MANNFSNNLKVKMVAAAAADNMDYVKASRSYMSQAELQGKKFGREYKVYIPDPGKVVNGLVADPDAVDEVEVPIMLDNNNNSCELTAWNTLTTQHHSPLKSGLRLLSHFNLQMRNLRQQGREITYQGPLSNEVGQLRLVHKYLASLQEETPLNSSTGNQALREGAEGFSQRSSSRVSLFMSKKNPKSSSRDGHISVLPSPFYPHCS